MIVIFVERRNVFEPLRESLDCIVFHCSPRIDEGEAWLSFDLGTWPGAHKACRETPQSPRVTCQNCLLCHRLLHRRNDMSGVDEINAPGLGNSLYSYAEEKINAIKHRKHGATTNAINGDLEFGTIDGQQTC